MTQYCSDHPQTPLKKIPAGVSKNKCLHGEEFMHCKQGKSYPAFMGCPVPGCKFTMPVIDEEPGADTAMKESKKFEEETEKDYSGKVKEAVKEFTKEVEEDEGPMTNKKWNIKAFEKSWGVFSSTARSEGMSPAEAIDKMHLWGWMDSVHEGTVGYNEWKSDVMERVENQGE